MKHRPLAALTARSIAGVNCSTLVCLSDLVLPFAQSVFTPTNQHHTYGVRQMTDPELRKPRRYARSTRSIKVGTHLWPDVMELIRQHAEEYQLTPSGAVHDCLRRYFQLPEIH